MFYMLTCLYFRVYWGLQSTVHSLYYAHSNLRVNNRGGIPHPGRADVQWMLTRADVGSFWWEEMQGEQASLMVVHWLGLEMAFKEWTGVGVTTYLSTTTCTADGGPTEARHRWVEIPGGTVFCPLCLNAHYSPTLCQGSKRAWWSNTSRDSIWLVPRVINNRNISHCRSSRWPATHSGGIFFSCSPPFPLTKILHVF